MLAVILATVSSQLGLAGSILGMATFAGAVFTYSRTQVAVNAQAATIGALQAGLAEARTNFEECEHHRALDRLANEKALAEQETKHAAAVGRLEGLVEAVRSDRVDQFIAAVRTIVREES